MAIDIKLFCEGTSIHGLAELYHAKHVSWKLLWLFIITGFSAVTGYMVYKSCDQFWYQESSTLFIPATNADLISQPVKFCIPHWLTWISHSKRKINEQYVNDSTLLYALSFLTPIFREQRFDNNTAAADLKNILKESKITLNEFYSALAKPIPTSPRNFFANNELIHLQHMHQMCYVANESQVESMIDSTRQISFFIRRFSQDLHDKFVNSEEYNQYVNQYCSNFNLMCTSQSIDINWNEVHFPNFLVVEKYNNLHFQISPSAVEYTASLKVSKHKWKKLRRNNITCIEDKNAFYSDRSCNDQCSIRDKYNTTSECMPVELSLLDGRPLSVEKTCRNNITWITPHPFDNDNIHVSHVSARLPPEISSANNNDKPCSAKCLDGCDKYHFDLSVSTSSTMQSAELSISNTATTINIKYPTVEDMVIMIETDSRTWEEFVGTVGGLLGVWTGASIMSLMQMFYLCCCASHAKKMANVRDCNDKV